MAVKVLFDDCPFSRARGVIQICFEEIRVAIKGLIMTHFLSEEQIGRFSEELAGLLPSGEGLEESLVEMLESEDAVRAKDRQLEELKKAPLGC